MEALKKKDTVYYARIIPNCGYYDVLELKVRTVEETWFSAMEKRDKHVYLLNYDSIGKIVFKNKDEALNLVKEAEKNKQNIEFHISYEEY